MESHMQAKVSPRRESSNRRLHRLWGPCVGHVITTRFSSVIAIIGACTFCLVLFNLRDTGVPSAPVHPEGIDGFRYVESGRRALQQVRAVNTYRNDTVAVLSTTNKMRRTLPNVIIIGARKAGTRALLEYLGIHPQVVSASREIHFFSDEENYARGMRWYQAQMPLSAPGQLTLEKTPNYLISNVTPERVHRMNSSVLLLLTLRHPVTRAISDYTQILANRNGRGQASKDFATLALHGRTGEVNQAYKPVYISTYHLHLARWLKLFPLAQIHIIDGDRLITEPLEELRAVETFLGLEHFFTSDTVYFNATRGFHCMRRPVNGSFVDSCLGASKGRSHPHVEQAVRTKLSQYFYKHNQILFNMIGRSFDWT
ncbi:sulfotransferase [Elysia marginata]|uniref:Sulfotransferase n=1 Tax=Elysia marginata TaxID=1093978 RepID=A0AAV4JP06_9GAST|nr:sulfotransferase [Elysia marginata]